MLFGLKFFITVICLYAGIRMCGIGLAWLKEFFDQISPHKDRWDD